MILYLAASYCVIGEGGDGGLLCENGDGRLLRNPISNKRPENGVNRFLRIVGNQISTAECHLTDDSRCCQNSNCLISSKLINHGLPYSVEIAYIQKSHDPFLFYIL